MPKNSFLDQKIIHKLSTNGIDDKALSLAINGDIKFMLELWKSQGLSLEREFNNYFFKSKLTPLDQSVFNIVDIETNGSNAQENQIIEIAALKVQNGKIIDRFNTLVKCNNINEHITSITGINADATKDAPKLKDVLYDFRLFLSDDIFVAHNVKFDYNFISQSMQKIGLQPILNRPLCTIDLAQRSIPAYRYALPYLNRLLKLHPEAKHHRAMCDVVATYELFKLSLLKIDEDIKSAEDLIHFSKHAKMLDKILVDPLATDDDRISS